MGRSWQCATDHGEIVKVVQLARCGQIVAVCHRSWRNCEGDTAFAMWSRSWHHATDHGEIVKVIQLVRCEQIVAVCHRSWRNCEGCTGFAMWSRSWHHATDRGEIVKVIQLVRCGADRGSVPQIMEVIMRFLQGSSFWTRLLPCQVFLLKC